MVTTRWRSAQLSRFAGTTRVARSGVTGELGEVALQFSGVPAKAKSLALIVEDPDVPKNLKADGMFDHWILWDIAPTAKGIAEGEGKGGMNETGTAGFMGPCPPDREHRYFFKLFALDTKLTGAKIAGKKDLEKAMDGHVLEKAELVGRYTKQ